MRKFEKIIFLKEKILKINLNTMNIKHKNIDYIALILGIIGYGFAVLSVVMFLNLNNIDDKMFWALSWLICCSISRNLLKK